MLIGQIGWAPEFETINGVIVADGSINPPCGIVDAPVKNLCRKRKGSQCGGRTVGTGVLSVDEIL